MADALHTPGVVSAVDARLADGGLLAVQGPSAIDIRTGVLIGPNATALVVGTTATGQMTVHIRPHHWVTSRSAATGPYRGTNEYTRTVNIAAAPAANSRIDVVYVKQQDNSTGIPSPDATTGELYGVVTGTAAVSPTKPALPVGAQELATVTVAAGATNTSGAGVTIANTAPITSLRGTPIPVRTEAERDALAATSAGSPITVTRLDVPSKPIEQYDGTTWRRYAFVEDTGWTNTPTPTPPLTVGSGGSRYRVKNGWCALRSHLVYVGSFANNFTVFTLPAARPAFSLVGPFTIAYGGSAHGQVFETVINTNGAVVVNGRGLTTDGIQLYVTYPVD